MPPRGHRPVQLYTDSQRLAARVSMLAFNSSRFNAMLTFKVATNYNIVELKPKEVVE